MDELIQRRKAELENSLGDKDKEAAWQKSEEMLLTVRQIRYALCYMSMPEGKWEDFDQSGLLIAGPEDLRETVLKMPYNLRAVGRIACEKKILPIDFTMKEICSCCTQHPDYKK